MLRVGEPPASLQTVALYLTQPLQPGVCVELGGDTLAFLFAGPLSKKMPLIHGHQSLEVGASSAVVCGKGACKAQAAHCSVLWLDMDIQTLCPWHWG